MKDTKFYSLLDKYVDGKLNAEQQQLVEDWLDSIKGSGEYQESWSNEDLAVLYNKFAVNQKPRRQLTWLYWTAAAIALLIGVFTVYTRVDVSNHEQEIATSTIFPAKDSVLLILENGEQIYLDQNQQSLSVSVDGIQYADGSLLKNTEKKAETLQIQIPKGRHFQLTLEDGTKVWLNAGARFKYPSHFDAKERRVELDGEAYFEVAHQLIKDDQQKVLKKPFVVKSSNQEVYVLGTKFNVDSYLERAYSNTTLMDGSVKVTNSHKEYRVLKPGDQSKVSENAAIQVIAAEVESVLDWKNNLFVFHDSNLKDVMAKISQWYDIEIDIKSWPKDKFYGEIHRNAALSEVLDMIQMSSDLKFKVIDNGKERRLMMQ